MEKISYYGRELCSYRSSLHTHCKTSDGQFTADEIIEKYSAEGYDVFAFTDHRKSNRVSELDDRGMTLISGMEIHPQGPRGITWHFVGLGVPEDFTEPQGDGQACIDAVNALGGVMICAHPYWCGFTSTEIATLKGLAGIEVFNTSTRYIGRAYNMQVWDELNDAGILHPAVAVDDTHGSRDLFMGWTMVMTNEPLSQKAVIQAIKDGDFYATQGPKFTRLSYEGGIFEAEFTPCTEVIGLSNLSSGHLGMVENINGPSSGIQEVTSCRFTLNRNRPNSWFRLQVRDRNGRFAWTNPFFVK